MTDNGTPPLSDSATVPVSIQRAPECNPPQVVDPVNGDCVAPPVVTASANPSTIECSDGESATSPASRVSATASGSKGHLITSFAWNIFRDPQGDDGPGSSLVPNNENPSQADQASFTPDCSLPGVYTIRVTVTDDASYTAYSDVSVEVTSAPSPTRNPTPTPTPTLIQMYPHHLLEVLWSVQTHHSTPPGVTLTDPYGIGELLGTQSQTPSTSSGLSSTPTPTAADIQSLKCGSDEEDVEQGDTLVIDVSENNEDDKDTITITDVNSEDTTNGDANEDGNSLEYTANDELGDEPVDDFFSYSISNDKGETATCTVKITINPHEDDEQEGEQAVDTINPTTPNSEIPLATEPPVPEAFEEPQDPVIN